MARLQAAEAELQRLREQEPVTAQFRFRHPQKTMPDWAPWQPCKVDMRRGNWTIDSMGYEVEYRNLYAAPVPQLDVRELVEALESFVNVYGKDDVRRWMAVLSEARAALAEFRGQS